MDGISVHPTIDISADRIGPSYRRGEEDAAEANGQATMRSARALVLGFDRGDISDAMLVRDLRLKAFRFFLLDPLRRALRHAMAGIHR